MDDVNVSVLSDDYKSLLSICRCGVTAAEDITDVGELTNIYDECVSCFNDACLLTLDMGEDMFEELSDLKKTIIKIKEVIMGIVRVKKEDIRLFHSDNHPLVEKVLDLLIDFN